MDALSWYRKLDNVYILDMGPFEPGRSHLLALAHAPKFKSQITRLVVVVVVVVVDLLKLNLPH